MKQGRCPLCLQDGKALCESHFIAEGINRRAGKGRVVMTPELFVAIQKPVKDYLLCKDCEQKFGRAEDYVISLLRQDESSFPLLERLTASKPLGSGKSGSLVYSATAAGVEVAQIAYFALSMFWRASVHAWTTLNGKTIHMPLRSYEEPVRKYLNNETGVPTGLVLRLGVCTDKESQAMVFAPVEWSNDLYTGYEMTVLGVSFTLVVGVKPAAKDWGLCCVNSKENVIFLEDCSEASRDHYRDLRTKARIARNLS